MSKLNFSYEKLKDFNEVLKYYKKQLDILIRLKPMIKFEISEDFKDPGSFISDRVAINNLGISISQNFEYIKNNSPSNINELILNQLDFKNDESIDEESKKLIESFKVAFYKIMNDNKITPMETIRQIRNSFLHGSYYVMFENDSDRHKVISKLYSEDNAYFIIEGNKKICLQSDKMEGFLPYSETIALLELLLYNIKAECTKGNREFSTCDKRYTSCKNEYFLRKYIDSFQSYYVIPKGKRDNGNIDEVISKVPTLKESLKALEQVDGTNFVEIQEFPNEEMQKRRNSIESFIRYIGKNNWKYLHNLGGINDFFEKIFKSTGDDMFAATASLSNSFSSATRMLYTSKEEGTELEKSLGEYMVKATFESPLIYVNMLLGEMNYACGYLKENSSEDNAIFEYHNLKGIGKVTPNIDLNEEKAVQSGVSGEEKQKKIDLAIENYKAQLNNVEKDIQKLNLLISKLNEKNPKREELNAKYQKSIEEDLEKKKKIMGQIFKLSIRREEYSDDYIDYSELFRHLRNSIAHGRYRIDYKKALERKDFNKIKVTFYDFDDKDTNKGKENPDFELELTADKIIKIISSVQNRVNEQLNRENQMEKVVNSKLDEIILKDKNYHDNSEIYEI